MDQPLARKSRIKETQMRCPRMHGLPKQTWGSIVIRVRTSSRVIASSGVKEPKGRSDRTVPLILSGFAHQMPTYYKSVHLTKNLLCAPGKPLPGVTGATTDELSLSAY